MGKFIGQTRLPYLWENFKSFIASKKYAGGTSDGGSAKKAASIPFGKVDSTSTATAFTATVEGITELKDGTCVYLMNGKVTSAAASTSPKCFTLNINGLGAKPVYYTTAAASYATTQFNVNSTMLFVYNTTRVSSGCWDLFYGFDSNTNTLGYQLRTNSSTLPAKFKTYRYRLLFMSADHAHFVAANASTSTDADAAKTPTTEKIDPFGLIVYYGYTTAINANANFDATYLWNQYTLNIGYSFNNTGEAASLTFPAPVYIKAAPQSDGSAIIDATTPYVQTLPSTDDGKIYIFLGLAYSATGVELRTEHPVYYYKDGAVRLWSNATEPDVSGKANVDDLSYVAFSGSYNDLDDTPFIPSAVTESTVSNWGFTKNTGTITGITMNGVNKGASGNVNLGTVLTEHQDISGKANKANSLAGYGITDAKIEGGVITLGNNTITPITSHQSLASYYTKSQVDNLIIPQGVDSVPVSTLPATGSPNTLYFLQGTNSFTINAWDGSAWVTLATVSGAYDAGGALS